MEGIHRYLITQFLVQRLIACAPCKEQRYHTVELICILHSNRMQDRGEGHGIYLLTVRVSAICSQHN